MLPEIDLAAQIAISAVEAGGELVDGTQAAGRRVNFPIVDTGFGSLTDDGLLLFDAAVNWLTGNVTSLPGDFNNDGAITVDDIDLLSARIAAGDNDVAFDLNGDPVVNVDDLGVWVLDFCHST